MESAPLSVQDLSQGEKQALVVDMLSRIIVHYGLWFNEVQHQLGMEKALAAMDKATKSSLGIAMKHLSCALGFELENGLPKALAQLDDNTLEKLLPATAKSWLANDGVWFQAVEFDHGMNDAKRCNDSCWTRFSPTRPTVLKNFWVWGSAPGLRD